MSKSGEDYAPVRKVLKKVCRKGDFPISVVGLDHGHIYGMVENTLEAGADIALVWDEDPEKIQKFRTAFPDVRIARSELEVFEDPRSKMILSSIVANRRWEVGKRALEHGKHYMSDKTGFTELRQLEVAKDAVQRTGLKWSVCFSERLQVESAILAGKMVENDEIGDVVQVMNIAPHLLNAGARPEWFFKKEQYGGILCDIGSHQIDQMLHFSQSETGEVVNSQVGNFSNPDYPELEDFGDCTISLSSGASGYCRLDWLTPNGLGTWGDGRLFILGTRGYIEVRKYINLGVNTDTDTVFLVNDHKRDVIHAVGRTGFPYFGQLITDCLEGTDKALPQAHVFEVSRLAIEAEQNAVKINSSSRQ